MQNKPSTSFSWHDEGMKERAEALLIGGESLSQFAYRAVVEKITRMENRDEKSRRALLARDIDALRPVVMEILREVRG
jgi:dsRNA-specific ribonuclease